MKSEELALWNGWCVNAPITTASPLDALEGLAKTQIFSILLGVALGAINYLFK